MDGFSAETWAKLTNAERLELCRTAAKEAEVCAKEAGPPMRDMYKKLATQWLELATEIERISRDRRS